MSEQAIQKLSVSRNVVFYPDGRKGPQLAAIITYVHSDECVNLTVFGVTGDTQGHTSVTFVQPGAEEPAVYFAEFPPKV